MAVGSTSTQLAWAIKQNFTPKVRRAATQKKTPLLSMIQTRQVFGEPIKCPLIGSAGAGVGSTYLAAAEAAAGLKGAQFLVTAGDFVGVVPLSLRADVISRTDKGGYFDLKKKEAELALARIGQDIAIQLGGNGGGAIGRGATLSVNTLTLADPGAASNFVEDMIVQSSAADGTSGSLRVGQMRVTNVDPDNNTVTFDSVAGITGFAATDYLFRKSLYAPAFKGLGAMFPVNAPTDTLHLLNRTGQPKYAGFRLPTATGNVIERVKSLASHGWKHYSATPQICALETKQWEQASKILTQQGYREISVKESTATIGYSKLVTKGASGKDIEFVGDPYLPTTQAWLLDLETCYIGHYGNELVNLQGENPELDQAASIYFPSYQELGSELRMWSMCNFFSEAPWMSGTVALQALPVGV